MFLLPPAWKLETGLSSEVRIPELWDTLVPVISGTFADSIVPPYPTMGQGNQYQSQGVARDPTISQSGWMGQGMGRGRGQGSQDGTSGTQGPVYTITLQTELADQSVIQGTFILFHLWARVLFNSGASHSFIAAS